jgi:peptide/nickel transport system permease protein
MFLLSLWAAVTINFVLPRMMPGNPALAMFARYKGSMSPQGLHALEVQFGFDNRPWIEQYLTYLWALVRGKFGYSFQYYPTPVSTIIRESLPWTIGLVGIATIISVFLGTALGIYISWRRGRLLDNILPPTTMFLQAVPYFWMAMLFVYVFGFRLGWFPMSHAYDTSLTPGVNVPFLSSVLYHAILPGFTILLGSFSGWLIGMRNNMISTLGEDYVVFAEAKGVSTPRLMFMYAARNAILPQITGFAIAIGNVVSGSILTEIVFSYPGIGLQLNNAVLNEDYPLIQASFLIIAVSVLLANFIVDLLYARLDPRIRTGGTVQ